MTSDEMIEVFKRVRKESGEEGGVAIDVSIEPLLRDHPDQLDDFLHKLSELQADDLAQKSGESKERLRLWIYEQHRTFFQNRGEAR